MENFAKRAKTRRKELGLSQEEVATLSGLKQPDVSKIELGKINQTTQILELAKALECNPEWLKTGEGPMEPVTATANITLPGFTVTATASNQAKALAGRVDTAINTEASQQQAVDLISSVMDMMDDAQREVMAGKLASWARAPDSPKIKKSIAESLASASKPKNITND